MMSETAVTNVLFCAFDTRPDALAIGAEAIALLSHHGVDAKLEVFSAEATVDATDSDLFVSLGGDGTFLKVSRVAHRCGARVMGVNLGRVGFLLPIEPAAIVEAVLQDLASSSLSTRLALEISIDGVLTDSFALNEVVVERVQPGHMVRLRTLVDAHEFLTYSADGVMVSTPTGSTGYNFSAGGPVVDVELPVLIMTPIAPHFTIDRSIVVGDAQVIQFEVLDKPAIVISDGVVVRTVDVGATVEIRKSPRPVRVVGSDGTSLGDRLRKGLRDGHA
jgi:NAD+ kinase